MDFLIGCLFIWLVCGVSILISNTKDLLVFVKKKLPITSIWQSFLCFPLWCLICIVLIIIYPAFYIKGILPKVFGTQFNGKGNE